MYDLALPLARYSPNQKHLPDEVTHELLARLHGLGVTAYEHLIADLLLACGYEEVCPLRDGNRPRRSHKGRTAHGGADLMARSRSGLAEDTVLVQVKQYLRPVTRRFVDELRGALIRTASRHALLVTTSYFSPAAVKAAQDDHIAPVHLVDGEWLTRLLIQNHIGLQTDKNGVVGVDKEFFQALTAAYPQKEPTPKKNEISALPTVEVAAAANKPINQKGGEMMGRTHALIGIASLWLLEWPGAITNETLTPLVFFAVAGALAPDLDAGDSKIKRFAVAGVTPLAPLSELLHGWLGHRGLMHSLAGIGLFAVLCGLPVAFAVGWIFGAALVLGYASHVMADACTKRGVPLLYPDRKRYHLLPKGMRLTTGSMAEELLLPILAFAVLLLMLRHIYNTP